MSILEILLLVTTALALFIPAFHKTGKPLPRWVDFVPTGLVVLILVHLVVDGFHLYMAVVYGMGIVLFLQTFKGVLRPGVLVRQGTRRQAVSALVSSIVSVVLILVGVVAGPMMASGMPEDASGKSCAAAFQRMHITLSRRYAFSQWKGVDWDTLKDKFKPCVAAAEAAENSEAYALALREYLFSIPDGHIKLKGEALALWQDAVGGSYGLSLIELDDGRTIVHRLDPGGPAEAAGIEWGAEILTWELMPVKEAIDQVAPTWWGVPPATLEGKRYVQQVLLTRAPIGYHAGFTFRNPGQADVTVMTLKAADDGMEPLMQAMGWWDAWDFQETWGFDPTPYDLRKPPEYRVLASGYGYVRVYHLIPEEGDPDFAAIMQQAVNEFNTQEVPGVIIDVRGNPGGHDTLVTAMMAYFVPQETFYESMHFENWLTGIHILDISIPLKLEPAEVQYPGPFVVLVDQHTRSSGEGFALVARLLPQGRVVGVYGTHGSFGMCCGWIKMPGGLEVGYPTGQSRDENGQIQLDADAALIGGVQPDVRVPLTDEIVRAMFLEGEDVVLRYAVEVLEGER